MTDRQYFFRTFRYAKPYRVQYGVGTFFYCAQQFFFPLVSSLLMAGVTAGIIAGEFSEVLQTVWQVGAMMLGIIALIGAGAYMYAVSSSYALRDMSVDVFTAFMKSGAESQKHSGEGIAAINTDINTAHNILSDAITAFLNNSIAIVFSLVTVFIVDWRMGLGVAAIGGLVLLLQMGFAKPLAKLGKAQLETNADAVKSLSNMLAGALTIRAYGRQERALLSFDRESGKLRGLDFKRAFLGMWQDLFTTVQGWLVLVVVFALGGWLVVSGEMDFAQIMLVLPLAGSVGGGASGLGASYAGLQPPIVAAKRMFAIIDDAPAQACAATGDPAAYATKDNTIRCQGLSFAYRGAHENALHDISLTVAANTMVAFVGESGSGKSTLLRTIMGMYPREALGISIGGRAFEAEKTHPWRSQFAYVDQSCNLFDMSIAENISMGKQGNATEAEILEASQRAHAHDFINAAPDGYAANCGEKGAGLSGGQKQRIAIARALVRKAPVLIFDEATAALNPETEKEIMQTIEELRADHTILITTHNLENTVTADNIVVMDKGRIAEMGTHADLLARAGIYARLWGESHGT